jgi:uncharacterized protein HemY
MNARMMYEELVVDLLQRRQQAGGRLDQATEDAIAGELGIYWRKMSDDERNRIEVQLALVHPHPPGRRVSSISGPGEHTAQRMLPAKS